MLAEEAIRHRRRQVVVTGRVFDGDAHQLDRAVDLLSAPRRRIFTTGGRFNAVAARILALHLEVHRPGVRFLRPEDRGPNLVDLSDQDVLVSIDLCRHQGATARFARAAAHRGTHVVLMTDQRLSPAAGDAEVVLTTTAEVTGPFDSFLDAGLMVEALVAGVIDRLAAQQLPPG